MTPFYNHAGITIHHGKSEDILPTLPDSSVDAIVTDPPYGKRFHDGGMGGAGRAMKIHNRFTGETIHGDKTPPLWVVSHMFRLLKSGGALYFFSQWMTERAWMDEIEKEGFTIRNRMIWVKPMWGAGDLDTTWGPQHESIIFATKGRHKLNRPRRGDVIRERGGCVPNRKDSPHRETPDFNHPADTCINATGEYDPRSVFRVRDHGGCSEGIGAEVDRDRAG